MNGPLCFYQLGVIEVAGVPPSVKAWMKLSVSLLGLSTGLLESVLPFEMN